MPTSATLAARGYLRVVSAPHAASHPHPSRVRVHPPSTGSTSPEYIEYIALQVSRPMSGWPAAMLPSRTAEHRSESFIGSHQVRPLTSSLLLAQLAIGYYLLVTSHLPPTYLPLASFIGSLTRSVTPTPNPQPNPHLTLTRSGMARPSKGYTPRGSQMATCPPARMSSAAAVVVITEHGGLAKA